MTKLIFLLGHRKQMGKDTTCDITEKILRRKNISFIRLSFAAKLKKHCAERYNLNLSKMETEEYKKSKPPHLGGLSVRDVLIKEGTFARQIWTHVWSASTYLDILNSGKTVGLISDFRYPNEYDCFNEVYASWAINTNNQHLPAPKLIRVLAHRPNGTFNSDGSDDQLPDLDYSYWDETLLNDIEDNNWFENLYSQVVPMVERNLSKYVETPQSIPCHTNS